MEASKSPALRRFVKALKSHGLEWHKQIDGVVAQCPAHLDGRPSLSVQWKDESGEFGSGIVLHCFANCTGDDIVRALGLTLADLFDYRPGEQDDEKAKKEDPTNAQRWTNLHEAWGRKSDAEWILYPLLDRSRATTIYAPAGKGKSLVALEVAAGLASGRGAFGQTVKRSKIIYWDMENDETLWVDRLKAMDYTPDVLDGYLFYYSFPDTPGGLDTEKGAKDFLREVDHHRPVAVILDTYASIVDGEENSADTARAFARNLVAPLKARSIASLRLDHTGWNSDHERGTSAKRGDVDYSWNMKEAAPNVFTFKNEKNRPARAPESFNLKREDEPHLRHVVDDDLLSGLHDPVQKIIDAMDALGLPNDASRKAAREAGITGSDRHIQEAVKRRKARDDGDPA